MKGGMHFYRGSGAGAARYFDEGHRGAEAYYTEEARVAVEIDTWRAGERAASTALAEPGELVAWVEGIEPATGEIKGRVRSEGTDRQPLRFVEVVVNNPKSLSIVASQNPVVANAVDRVLARQADEIARYLCNVAVTRIGPRGSQREVAGLEVQTARVRHLTSREGDPHRHIHLMLNTRVKTQDGTWHALHSAAIRQHTGAIHERAARVLASDLALRDVLATQGYTLGTDGEIDQARGAVELLSKRATLVAENRERNETAWRAEHPGREPSQRVRNGWDQAGWEQGRKRKATVHETAVEMSQRVRLELAGAGFDFIPGANEPVEWSGVSVGQVDREAVSNDAIAGLSARRSAWSEAELTAGVDAALTASTVVGDHQAVGELAEDCRARARERCVSLLDPELSSPTAMSRHLSSEAVLASDMALNLGLAGLAGIEQTNVSQPTAVTHGGLDAGQAAALEAICGDRRLEVVIGPAGAGKTMMLAAARETLDTQSRDMVIVAPTRKAALVAGAEIGTDASSLSKLLYDHGYRWDDQDRWTRLAVGEADPQGRVHHRLAPEATLSQRSVIVVDEAALMTVSQANVLLEVCHESGAALRLVGDPRQLGAIGRGGVMETAARWAGGAVTLDEVHRFLCEGTDAAGLPTLEPDTDYASLSLAMRQGDDPDAVASRLIDRGGVVVHASHADAIAAIAEQVAAHGAGAGDGATAVTAATNEEALALNLRIRDRRVAAKQVDDTRVARGMDNVAIGAGDRIVTRRNDTTRDVANREAFTVEAIASDGTLSARAGERHVRLDASYVAEAVQLGYATTDYGNQGVTTDTSITLVSDSTSAGGLYVGATRGRYANTLHVVAPDTDQAREAIVAAMGRDRSDKGLDIARVAAEEASEPARREGVHEAETDSPATMEQLNEERLNRRAAQERADQEARATAAALFDQARQHRDLAVSLEAGLAEQASRAAAAFLADRNDARAIKAGPGLLGRRADAVSQAQCRRGEFARSWPGAQQAQWDWSDDRAVQGATDHVSQGVRQGAAHQRQQATALESQAQGYLDAIANREEAARMVALVAGGFPGGMSNPLRSLRRSPAPIAEAEVEKMPLSPAQSQDRSPEHGLEM